MSSTHGSCPEMAEHVIALQLDVERQAEVLRNLLKLLAERLESRSLAASESVRQTRSLLALLDARIVTDPGVTGETSRKAHEWISTLRARLDSEALAEETLYRKMKGWLGMAFKTLLGRLETEELAELVRDEDELDRWLASFLASFPHERHEVEGIFKLERISREMLGSLSTRLTTEEERRRKQDKARHNQVSHQRGKVRENNGLRLVKPAGHANWQAGR